MLWGLKGERVFDVIAIGMLIAGWALQVIITLVLYALGWILYLIGCPVRLIQRTFCRGK